MPSILMSGEPSRVMQLLLFAWGISLDYPFSKIISQANLDMKDLFVAEIHLSIPFTIWETPRIHMLMYHLYNAKITLINSF